MARYVDDDPPIKTHPASQEYRDNWDRVFGEKLDEEIKDVAASLAEPALVVPDFCEKCDRRINDLNINWNAPREPVCVVCAYPTKETP